MFRKVVITLLVVFAIASLSVFYALTKTQKSALVLITDFGVKDGAVAAMKGVALKLAPNLIIHDLTHEIPAYNIWEGAFRLQQTAPYWAAGTVFVCVVDPGVGTERKSIILKTKANHYFVGPDNGLFTLVAESEGIEEIREISVANRLPNSQNSYTFHGRDIFAYSGAKLAAGEIEFEEVGEKVVDNQLLMVDYPKPKLEDGLISGGIPILD
ncbi:MAG: SAM-dependent chlorinase/fluorinase, partial [Emticicia sp.]|nr:SAM-dependent chlorinase/fluorinase [Emticicia sp.]